MPYENEHAARLQNPDKFDPKSYRRTNGGVIYGTKRVPKTIAIIWGKFKTNKKASDNPIPQSLRFATKYWSAAAARKWLKDNKIKYIMFEAATKEKKKTEQAGGDVIIENRADDIFAVMASLEAELWAMEPVKLQSFFKHLVNMKAGIVAAGKAADPKYKTVDGIAYIPVKGVLMKQVPRLFTVYGIEATSYQDIASQITAAISDKQVSSIVLDIDSPGGLVSGVLEAADAIRAARSIKPVTAVVDDLAASGAYWLASQAGLITASRTAQIGSIGVFSVYVDYSEAAKDRGIKVHVIRSGEHKGMGVIGAPITDEQIKGIQNIIDQLAEQFTSYVIAGRGKKKKDIEKAATGQIWLSGEAVELGLADSVYRNINQLNQILRGIAMDEKEKAQVDAQVEANKIAEQQASDDRQAIKEFSQAFPDDLQYALTAFGNGKTLVEAKADYCDVLREKLKAVTADLTEAQAKLSAAEQKKQADNTSADGIEPIKSDASDSAESTGGDFMQQALDLADQKKISRSAAIKELARKNPELHKAWVMQQKKKSA